MYVIDSRENLTENLFQYRLQRKNIESNPRKHPVVEDFDHIEWYSKIKDFIWSDEESDYEINSSLYEEPIEAWKRKEYFLIGCHSDDRNEILKYLTCLRNDIERDMSISNRIIYEKITHLVILLSPEEKFKGYQSRSSLPKKMFIEQERTHRKKQLLEESLKRIRNMKAILKRLPSTQPEERLRRFKQKTEAFNLWRDRFPKQREEEWKVDTIVSVKSKEGKDKKRNIRKSKNHENKKTEKHNNNNKKVGIDDNNDNTGNNNYNNNNNNNDKGDGVEEYCGNTEILNEELKGKHVTLYVQDANETTVNDELQKESPVVNNLSETLLRQSPVVYKFPEAFVGKDVGGFSIQEETENKRKIDEEEEKMEEHFKKKVISDMLKINEIRLEKSEMFEKQMEETGNIKIKKKTFLPKISEFAVVNYQQNFADQEKKIDTKLPKLKKTKNLKRSQIKSVSKDVLKNDKQKNIKKRKERRNRRKTYEEEPVVKEKQVEYLECTFEKLQYIDQLLLKRNEDISPAKSVKKTRKKKMKSITLNVLHSVDHETWVPCTPDGELTIYEYDRVNSLSIPLCENGIITRCIRLYPKDTKHNYITRENSLLAIRKEIRHEPRKRHTKPPVNYASKIKEKIEKDKTKVDILPPIQTPSVKDEPKDINVKAENPVEQVPKLACKDFEDDLVVNIQEETPSFKRYRTPSLPKSRLFSISTTEELSKIEEENPKTDLAKKQFQLKQKLLDDRARKLKVKQEVALKIRRQSEKIKTSANRIIRRNSIDERKAFFEKYCIISEEQKEWYKAVYGDFQAAQEDKNADISLHDAIDCFNIVNKTLQPDVEFRYVIMVFDVLGLQATDHVDEKTFMLVAAFSEKIMKMRSFFKLHFGKLDFNHLLTSLSKVQDLYKILLRNNETSLFLEDLLVEVNSTQEEKKWIDELLKSEHKKLDFLDYITYFPLFLHMHDKLIEKPI